MSGPVVFRFRLGLYLALGFGQGQPLRGLDVSFGPKFKMLFLLGLGLGLELALGFGHGQPLRGLGLRLGFEVRLGLGFKLGLDFRLDVGLGLGFQRQNSANKGKFNISYYPLPRLRHKLRRDHAK